ncbi:MAG: DUF465 domain-containing protein [Cellvibrionales bacterium]|nr:DUF465 domain-containing protein [Cellvibrionales bacterium]
MGRLLMNITQLDALREKLKELRLQHRALDEQVNQLTNQAYVNSLEIQRLKKRKLALKDTISKIESQLIPDMNA